MRLMYCRISVTRDKITGNWHYSSKALYVIIIKWVLMFFVPFTTTIPFLEKGKRISPNNIRLVPKGGLGKF